MRHTSSVLAAVLVLALTVVGAAGPFFNMAKQMTAPDAAPDGREIAQTIWFQGYLADKVTGDPIEGEHTVEITILDAEVLGNEIWGPEAHDETIFSAGWFSVEMGIDEPLPAFEDPPYYLEISVDSEVFDPRIRIASVPFAFHANSAEESDSAWIVDGNVMYPATAETVAIGTTDPFGKLHVATDGYEPGVVITSDNADGIATLYFGDMYEEKDGMMLLAKFGDDAFAPIWPDGGQGKGILFTDPGSSGLVIGTETGPIDFHVGGVISGPEKQPGSGFVRFTHDGRVGIGTPEPDTTFHVVGSIKTDGFQMPTGAADGYVLKSDENGFGTWQEGGESDGDWTVDGATMYPATAETVVIGGTAGWSPLTVWGDGFFPNAYFSTPTAMGSASILLAAGDDVPSGLVIGHTGETPEKGERQFGDAGKGFMVSGPAATGLQIMSENGPIDFHVDTSGPARQDHAMTITEAGDVGIGTTMPDARLQVTEEGHMGVTVNSSDDWGTATALIQAGTGLNDYLRFQHFGPTASGTMNGVPLAGKGVVQAGTGSDGLVLSAGSGDSMYVMIGSSEIMRLTSDGEVGIGTTTPDTTLHVSGGIKTDAFQLPTGASDGHVLTSDASGNASWEASAPTDNDWTMSGATMYPATAETIVVGTTVGLGPLTVTGDGVLPQGTFYGQESEDASVMLFADDDQDNHLMLGVNTLGPVARGARTLSSPGEAYLTSGPDNFGLQIGAESGYIDFTLGTDGPARDIDAMRITADGEVGIGTTSPDTTLHVSGGIKADAFQMPTGAGNGYILTSDAVGNAVWDAPTVGTSGIIIDKWVEGSTTSIGGTGWNQYDDAEVSVTVPGSGYVMVTSSVHVLLDHFNGTEDHLLVGHTDDLGDAPSPYSTFNYVIPSSYPSASEIDVGFTVSSMHEITSSGTYTYYLVGQMISGQGFGDQFYYAETRAIYYPYTIPAMSAEQQHELELIEQKKALLNE